MSRGSTDALLASPPVAVATATLAGISLQDWVYILTITYTAFLIAEKAWKAYRAWKDKRAP